MIQVAHAALRVNRHARAASFLDQALRAFFSFHAEGRMSYFARDDIRD